jgi:hypothetical protein
MILAYKIGIALMKGKFGKHAGHRQILAKTLPLW